MPPAHPPVVIPNRLGGEESVFFPRGAPCAKVARGSSGRRSVCAVVGALVNRYAIAKQSTRPSGAPCAGVARGVFRRSVCAVVGALVNRYAIAKQSTRPSGAPCAGVARGVFCRSAPSPRCHPDARKALHFGPCRSAPLRCRRRLSNLKFQILNCRPPLSLHL